MDRAWCIVPPQPRPKFGEFAARRGWRYAVDQLVSAGAPAPGPHLDAWLDHALATVVRRVAHPGCLKYALPFSARVRRALPASKPFPKVSRPRCVALVWRCA